MAPPPSRESSIRKFLSAILASRTSDSASAPPAEPKTSLSYSFSTILWLDIQGRLRRGKSQETPNAYQVSQLLRVIGDHLDRKQAEKPTVWLSAHSATVVYEHGSGRRSARDTFTVDELYNRAVHMYLRRRRRARGEA